MRLIDADAAKSRIIKETTKTLAEMNIQTLAIALGMANMFDCEDDFPTIEAEPVRHGEWIIKDNIYPVCSECGELSDYECDGTHKQSLFCPNCGAKMEGGV